MTAYDNSIAIQEIAQLRQKHDAIILAHNYQNDEIQELADHIGDSLALSQIAAQTAAKVIVFCGVHFMAESAKILSPEKIVLLPAATAGCPMADMAEADEVLQWRQKHPKAAVVTYINSSASVKAVSDYCCTSANAIQLVKNIPESEIIFLPDQNLGRFVATQVPEKTLHLWPGYCVTHHRVNATEVRRIKALHPDAPLLVHPECQEEVTAMADFVGSTSQIIQYVRHSRQEIFIVSTEMGILYSLKQANPTKTFYLASPGLICPNMKQTTVEKVLTALRHLQPEITVTEAIRKKAQKALERMLQYTA